MLLGVELHPRVRRRAVPEILILLGMYLQRYLISITNLVMTAKSEIADQDLYGGLIRLHILHHATEGAVFGFWFIEELARHGYRLSPGTLYPLLHGLERKGYLRSTKKRSGKIVRRMYRTGVRPSGWRHFTEI